MESKEIEEEEKWGEGKRERGRRKKHAKEEIIEQKPPQTRHERNSIVTPQNKTYPPLISA